MFPLFRNRRGAQAVEFALTLPVLVLVTSATVDWGWYFHQSMAVTQAAVQGNVAAANTKLPADRVPTGEAVAVSVWNANPGLPDIDVDDVVTTVLNTTPVQVQTVVTVPYSCLICVAASNPVLSHTAVHHYQY